MNEQLFRHSIEVIKRGQAENGAFLASPNFSTYQYCWLRDGTFIAYAMDVVGEHEVAARVYRWVHRAIIGHLWKVERLLEKKRAGASVWHPDEFLHTRYTVEGQEGTEPWGNFQLDGYGAYLWGVAEHVKRSGDAAFLDEVRTSVEATVQYLLAFWDMPNFDCWEEHGQEVHPSTLASVYGGLGAIGAYLEEERIESVREQIREFVAVHGVTAGRFCKSVGNPAVDANLLWLSVPFALVEVDDVRMIRTVEAIEAELVSGGVHRYPGDSFYGGGAWILLAAWLGWYYAQAGRVVRAEELLAWVERQADPHGDLPEQVAEGLFHPAAQAEWVQRWGEVAKPLLWSHAMYLILQNRLSS
ncbi:MAG: glycoside hydrolase family 15 protein [Tumebacillaceae bacterium]